MFFQVVGKSCKPIPVMILGVVFGRKVYSWKKYVFTLMIVIGKLDLFLFLYMEASEPK